MEFVFGLFWIVLFFFSWIFWGVLLCIIFLLAAALPWGVWEGFMYLTFNNLINLVSKIPSCFGYIIGFLFSLPLAIPGVVISLWSCAQVIFMGILVFNGDPASTFAQNYLSYVQEWEFSSPGSMVIARFFYEHCQWLWGGAGMFKGYYFWQNGVWSATSAELPVPLIIVKLLLLSIPYTLMFLLSLLPVFWSVIRPFAGAFGALPAVISKWE